MSKPQSGNLLRLSVMTRGQLGNDGDVREIASALSLSETPNQGI